MAYNLWISALRLGYVLIMIILHLKTPKDIWRTGWDWSYTLWGYCACSFTVSMYFLKRTCLKVNITEAFPPRLQLNPVTIQNLGQYVLELWSKSCAAVSGLLAWRMSCPFSWDPSLKQLLPPNPEQVSVKIHGDLNRRHERSLLQISFTAPCLWTSKHVLPLW